VTIPEVRGEEVCVRLRWQAIERVRSMAACLARRVGKRADAPRMPPTNRAVGDFAAARGLGDGHPGGEERLNLTTLLDRTHEPGVARQSAAQYPGWDSNPHAPKDTAF
jgi:hypothetical protein